LGGKRGHGTPRNWNELLKLNYWSDLSKNTRFYSWERW
jgi:hypothetical protein